MATVAPFATSHLVSQRDQGLRHDGFQRLRGRRPPRSGEHSANWWRRPRDEEVGGEGIDETDGSADDRNTSMSQSSTISKPGSPRPSRLVSCEGRPRHPQPPTLPERCPGCDPSTAGGDLVLPLHACGNVDNSFTVVDDTPTTCGGAQMSVPRYIVFCSPFVGSKKPRASTSRHGVDAPVDRSMRTS